MRHTWVHCVDDDEVWVDQLAQLLGQHQAKDLGCDLAVLGSHHAPGLGVARVIEPWEKRVLVGRGERLGEREVGTDDGEAAGTAAVLRAAGFEDREEEDG